MPILSHATEGIIYTMWFNGPLCYTNDVGIDVVAVVEQRREHSTFFSCHPMCCSIGSP